MIKLPLRSRLKIFRQRLSRGHKTRKVASFLLAMYIRLVYWTCRKQIVIHEKTLPYAYGKDNAIFSLWHGRLMMIAPLKPCGKGMFVLISHHNDGELIAQAVERFGIHTIRGSSSKGGMSAGRDVIRMARKGENITITPDGPRGPARKVQPGIIQLASITGKVIIPTTYSISHCRILQSWDSMMIPYPFSRLMFRVGEPIQVPERLEEKTMDYFCQLLENRMNTETDAADKACRSN